MKTPWNKYFAEFLGTGILLLLGLSLVIFMFGEGSPAAQVIPEVKLRQIMSGFLFGCVGASIALSSIGKVSGAHINPAVTLAFRLYNKIDLKTSFGFFIAQLTGAVISGEWTGWWIYWVVPVVGTLLASIALSAVAKRITEAKLYHFDSETDRLLRKKS